MTAVVDTGRITELAKLPKRDLVAELRAAGHEGGIKPLEKWSNHDLAAVLARSEQTAEVA